MGGVRRFGEKRGLWRIIERPSRSGVQSSNSKQLRIRAGVPTRPPGEDITLGKLAEVEELGSNLLRVAKSGLWVRAVPPRGARPRSERETAERVPNGSAGRPSASTSRRWPYLPNPYPAPYMT